MNKSIAKSFCANILCHSPGLRCYLKPFADTFLLLTTTHSVCVCQFHTLRSQKKVKFAVHKDLNWSDVRLDNFFRR